MKKLITTLLCAAFGGAQVLFSAEVKFVDYVESDGSQYVNLGIKGRSDMRVTTRMSWIKLSDNAGYIGARSGGSRFFPLFCYKSMWYLAYSSTSKQSALSAGEVYDVVSVLRKGEQTLTVNGKTVIPNMGVTTDYNSGLDLYLFAINYSGGNFNSSSRCYSLKIETNTVDGAWVTARDLMPIAVDGVGALYDMVSGKIYSSATATPLKASSNPSSAFSISRSALSTAGEIKVFAKVDTLDGLVPCTLTAVVRDCVSGETITKPLGVAEDSELHDYVLSGLTPDGVYEITVHGTWPNLGSDGLESDLYVFQVSAAVDTAKGSIYMVGPDAELDGDPMDWLVKSSGLHRLPLDGDKIIIGQTGGGTYALNITNSVTRTFNGWTGAGAASVVSETTIGAGSTLNITNTTAYSGKQSGSKASFVVDGGTLHIKSNTQEYMYGTDTLTIKNGGTFLRDGVSGSAETIRMQGNSRIYLQDGNFTTPSSSQAPNNAPHFWDAGGTPAFIQTGGTASCGSLSFQAQSDNYYEISGGSMSLSNYGIKHGHRSGSVVSCGTLRMRGSKFTFTVVELGSVNTPGNRTLLSTFFDYRIRSDADPGAKGVGFINYTGTGIKGAIRAIPDGGVAIVHTNLFPLIVQKSTKTLTFANDFKGGAPSYKFWSTGLFDIGVPEGLEHMIRADLKPEAELADGWTSEVGVSAGFVKLPRIGTPDKLQKANLKLKIEPQGTKTLASIKSDLEEMGFAPVTVDETAAYNLVVGLPKDRLAKGFADSKVLMDFTTVSGAKAMQTNTVTTNALIKAVALDILKPGLILMVR